MGKHDIGTRRRRGRVHGLVLSREWVYDIDDVMGGLIFDDDGNPMWKNPHDVTAEDLQEMRRKIGEHI